MKRVIAVSLLLIGATWLTFRLIDWGGCAWYGHQTERDTRYAAFVGCMVKTHNGWVPRAELRTQQ